MKQTSVASISFVRAICLLLVLFLAGCAEHGMGDLQQYVMQVKAKKGGGIAPLPEVHPIENYVYSAFVHRDPFARWDTTASSMDRQAEQVKLMQDSDRFRESLEEFPLDTLRMVGTLGFPEDTWGLIKAPDGIIYKVRSGSRMGQNHGKVLKVDNEKITLTEIVPDGLGGWEERQASLMIGTE